jgi:hypothetical protein
MSLQDPTDSMEGVASESSGVSLVDTDAPGSGEETALDPDSDVTAGSAAAGPIGRPIVIPLPKRLVSGRYLGTLGGFRVELRVDVDRVRPGNRVSGDFYQVSGSTTSYVGSFVANTPTVATTATLITIDGLATFTFAASRPRVRVTIPRTTISQPQAAATLAFLTTSGVPGAVYPCPFSSIHFRTVRIETDRVSNVTTPVFASYNTGALPSGGPARNLSVLSAYAEAGIQMIPSTGADVIQIAEAGASWSNAELHASMVRHFSLWQETTQWSVWQVVCQLHDLGTGLYGIMFDQAGRQRQGCAVFHAGIGGTSAEQLRLQLYTYVHELGHCFNLLHSWQKSLATPPGINRPAAQSWMNYPWNFPGGPGAFWSGFPFQFDSEELRHLRHAFRNNIIMGGANFATGSALQNDEAFADPVQDDSGLQLVISAPSSLGFGEPTVIELKLLLTDTRGKTVHPHLHPNYELVQVGIRKPSGRLVVYEPFLHHCIAAERVHLRYGDILHDSAYIGFGRDGQYFDEPGQYQLRAVYTALDGARVVSNVISLRVRYPTTATDNELAELFLGEEQGALLCLLGSDAEPLQKGRDAFELVLDKHPKHRLATYARLQKGINKNRAFKTIVDGVDGRATVRPADPTTSTSLLAAVVDANVLDDISQEMVQTFLAEARATMARADGSLTALAIPQARPARGISAKLISAT